MAPKRGVVDIPSPFFRARVTEVNIQKNIAGAVRVFIPDLMVEGVDPDWEGDGGMNENWCECDDVEDCMDQKFGWLDEDGNPVADERTYYTKQGTQNWIVGDDEYGNQISKEYFGVDGEWKEDEDPKGEPYGITCYPANSPVGGYNRDDPCSRYQRSVYVPLKGDWVWVFFEKNNTGHCYYIAAYMGQHARMPWENTGVREPNRVYTLLKTRMGRSIVMADSRDVQRIEIMGKKRFLPVSGGGSKWPGGDLFSTYAIDEWKDNCADDQDPVYPPEIKNSPYRSTNPTTGQREEKRTTILLGCQAFEISEGAQSWLDTEGMTLQQWLNENDTTLEQFIDENIDIPGNATTILFDERKDKEKILIRTLFGDFVHIDIDERSLQIDFKNDISIKCGGDLSLDVGGDVHLRCENNYQTAEGSTYMKSYLHGFFSTGYSFGCCWPWLGFNISPESNPKHPTGLRDD